VVEINVVDGLALLNQGGNQLVGVGQFLLGQGQAGADVVQSVLCFGLSFVGEVHVALDWAGFDLGTAVTAERCLLQAQAMGWLIIGTVLVAQTAERAQPAPIHTARTHIFVLAPLPPGTIVGSAAWHRTEDEGSVVLDLAGDRLPVAVQIPGDGVQDLTP